MYRFMICLRPRVYVDKIYMSVAITKPLCALPHNLGLIYTNDGQYFTRPAVLVSVLSHSAKK